MAGSHTYVALLRGINVGGRNLIPMPALRELFEGMGFEDVATYIQSGNVLFRGSAVEEAAMEAELASAFDYHGRVVAMTAHRYRSSLATAPEWWGAGDAHRHNALFTLSGTTPSQVLKALPSPTEYESIATAPGVIFWSGLKERITRTMFVSKLGSHPLYKQLTVRNHNTASKLATLLAEL